MYKPSAPFSTAMKLYVPTLTKVQGVNTKVYPKDGDDFNASFKTYGGTEREVNGTYDVEDTATVETWYDPKFTSACRVEVVQTGGMYEIIGEPENIEMRNQYLRFKVRRVKGGA